MVLIASSLAVVLSLALQDPAPQQPRVVGVDENGWPVFAELEDAPAPAPAVETARPGSDRLGRPVPEPVGTRRGGTELADVFARVGTVADFRALHGIAAHCQLRVLDQRGAVLGVSDWLHEADVRAGVERDRLALPDRRVHGRDGPRVFASLHGLRMASEEPLARAQLELFGSLLRAPWCFADPDRYELLAVRDAGSLEPRREFEFRPLGVTGNDRPERFVLRCAADTLQPVGLRYRLAPGRDREVRFGDWREVDRVRMPFRIEWVDAAGAVTSAMTVQELSVGHRFPERQFRPLR